MTLLAWLWIAYVIGVALSIVGTQIMFQMASEEPELSVAMNMVPEVIAVIYAMIIVLWPIFVPIGLLIWVYLIIKNR